MSTTIIDMDFDNGTQDALFNQTTWVQSGVAGKFDGAENTLTFDAATASDGSFAVKSTGASGLAYKAISSNQFRYRDNFQIVSASSGEAQHIRLGVGSTRYVDARLIESLRLLRIYDYSGTEKWRSTITLAYGTKYWREFAVHSGTGTTDGKIYFALYAHGSNIPLEEVELTNANCGSGVTFTRFYAFHYGSGHVTSTDNMKVVTGDYSTPLGMFSTNTNPVADAGPDQTAIPGETVYLDGTGSSDSDGTIVDWLWELIDGDPITIINPDTSTPSFVVPYSLYDKTYTIRLTVTDDDGATSTDTMDVTATPHPNWYLNSAGIWRPQVLSWL